jgi:hypothetical protein
MFSENGLLESGIELDHALRGCTLTLELKYTRRVVSVEVATRRRGTKEKLVFVRLRWFVLARAQVTP